MTAGLLAHTGCTKNITIANKTIMINIRIEKTKIREKMKTQFVTNSNSVL